MDGKGIPFYRLKVIFIGTHTAFHNVYKSFLIFAV